ncbi:MAG: uroporphyrinogen-III synthase, partial [bacterium]
GERVLLVQGTHAPGWLCDELDRRGADVTRLSLHRVQPNPELGRPPPEHDVIYFTSPSGARAWHGAYGDEGFGAETWCIGEVTRKQLTELGFDGKVVSPHVPDDTHSAKQTD